MKDQMKWSRLLSGRRFGMEAYRERAHERTDFQRDYDRLIFSSPFRRLQNKTQVFPLPGSVFVHNRLTHSLEVSCVGRSLGNNVSKALMERYPEESINFPEIGSIVSAACLAHDLGNPPYGHSGERAISSYFKEGNGKKYESIVRSEGGRWEDFSNFEGNANAIRLLTHQFRGRRTGGFALTYSTLASVVKYPYSSELGGKKGKFGFFQTEEADYIHIAQELGIIQTQVTPAKFARYPLVYLVEAADDICYQVMDIEDAYKLRLISKEETLELLLQFFSEEAQLKRYKVMDMVDDTNEKIAYLRSCIIGLLVDECSQVFLSNEAAILSGTFDSSLIDHISDTAKQAYKHCSQVALQKIYKSKEVVDIELAGYRIFTSLLDIVLEAMMNPTHGYSRLVINRIPEQYNIEASTTYGKIQCALDYISGMTDVYALDLYRKITGMSLPAV
jgi:dGTPase